MSTACTAHHRPTTATQPRLLRRVPGSTAPAMTADPGPGGSPTDSPISDSAARQIASGFTLPVADVVLDAQQVFAWTAAADDLLVWLEHRHRWTARGAVGYLLSLRSALRHTTSDGSAG